MTESRPAPTPASNRFEAAARWWPNLEKLVCSSKSTLNADVGKCQRCIQTVVEPLISKQMVRQDERPLPRGPIEAVESGVSSSFRELEQTYFEGCTTSATGA